MSFTYDLSTTAGKVRLLISDRDETAPIFSDEEITAYLSLSGDSVFLAAAQALETIAASEVLVQKRIRSLDHQTDGPAEAAALRALAKSLREREDATATVDVAEMVFDPFGRRERLYKQALRNQL